MRELSNKFHDVEMLLGLAPEELAAEILFILKSRPKTAVFDPAGFFPNRLCFEFISHQKNRSYLDASSEVALAISEALNWLAVHGLIAIKPENTEKHSGAWCLSRRARQFTELQQFTEYQISQLLPKQLLHPKLKGNVWLAFMRGTYEAAVFEATREVEISVREAAKLPTTVYGTQLMRDAFNPKNGCLKDNTLISSEQEAMRDLFTGVIGAYKNPHSHRHAPIDGPRWAIEIILLASHLLHIVDSRRNTVEN